MHRARDRIYSALRMSSTVTSHRDSLGRAWTRRAAARRLRGRASLPPHARSAHASAMLLTTPPADASALPSSPGCTGSLFGDTQGLPCFTSTRQDRSRMAQIACHAFITRRLLCMSAPSSLDTTVAARVHRSSTRPCASLSKMRQLPRVGPAQAPPDRSIHRRCAQQFLGQPVQPTRGQRGRVAK